MTPARRHMAGLSAAMLVSGCTSAASPSAEQSVIPVSIALARSVADAREVQGTGIATYEREADLSFRVSGVIAAMSVRIGDRVRAGQPLALLTATDLVEQAASRQSELDRAQRTLTRLSALAEGGAIAGSDAQDQRDVVAQARAAAATARYDLQSSTLRAPFAGVVIARRAEAGETVASGNVIVRVADPRSPFIVRVGVTSADAVNLRTGDRAAVAFGASGPLPAQVLRIQPSADRQTGTRIVEVRLARPQVGRIGEIAQVRIRPSIATGATTVAVPAEALAVSAKRRTGVFTLTVDRKARFLRASLIRFQDDVAIMGGLPVGTRVITAGAGFLRGGETVRITKDVRA